MNIHDKFRFTITYQILVYWALDQSFSKPLKYIRNPRLVSTFHNRLSHQVKLNAIFSIIQGVQEAIGSLAFHPKINSTSTEIPQKCSKLYFFSLEYSLYILDS